LSRSIKPPPERTWERRRGAAARCRGIGHVFELILKSNRRAAGAVEAGLQPCPASNRCNHTGLCARTTANQPADARLPAQQRVYDHAEPGGTVVVVEFVILIRNNIIIIAFGTRPAEASSGGQRQGCGDAEDHGHRDSYDTAKRRAEKHHRQAQHRIARNAAEAGRQGP
jgi:hypothetical protein